MPPRGDRAPSRGDAQALALTEELGAQLGRMKGAGAKLVQLLSMLAFQRERCQGALGALRAEGAPVPGDSEPTLPLNTWLGKASTSNVTSWPSAT